MHMYVCISVLENNWGQKRPWRSCSPDPLLRVGSATASCSGHVNSALIITKDKHSKTSLDNLFQSLTTLTGKRFFFSCLSRILCIPVCVHCLLSCHWLRLRPWLHLLNFPFRYLYMLIRPPLSLLFWLNNRSSISLFSYVGCFNNFIIIMALCWTHFSMFVSLLHWRSWNQTQYSTCISPALRRGEGSLPLNCWQHSA